MGEGVGGRLAAFLREAAEICGLGQGTRYRGGVTGGVMSQVMVEAAHSKRGGLRTENDKGLEEEATSMVGVKSGGACGVGAFLFALMFDHLVHLLSTSKLDPCSSRAYSQRDCPHITNNCLPIGVLWESKLGSSAEGCVMRGVMWDRVWGGGRVGAGGVVRVRSCLDVCGGGFKEGKLERGWGGEEGGGGERSRGNTAVRGGAVVAASGGGYNVASNECLYATLLGRSCGGQALNGHLTLGVGVHNCGCRALSEELCAINNPSVWSVGATWAGRRSVTLPRARLVAWGPYTGCLFCSGVRRVWGDVK
ncbi:hypothetical protein Tco_0691645 [Tanacetum coccineum]